MNEAEFAKLIRENKGTIYTVCYIEDMDLQSDLEHLYLHRPQEKEPQDSTAHGRH